MLQKQSTAEKIGAGGNQRYKPTLIQVVPWRGLEPNGVADYSLALARALAARHGVKSVFLSATPSAQALPMQDEWKTVFLRRRQAQCIADTLWSLSAEIPVAVVLHLSGYGYQKRGVPLWLVEGLRIWARRARHVPLVTIFHELYASGRPWQSAFWLSPLQKHIASRILNLSSLAITTTDLHRKRLSRWRKDSAIKITAMPVFSSVGEPSCVAPPCTRGATAVVFGLAGVEDRFFATYRSQTERIIATLGIETIFDVGPRLSAMPRTLAGALVISKGVLAERAVSDLLLRTKFGFVAYPTDFIAKSSRFAAYAAHGVVPIVFSEKQGAFDGLQPSQHFLDGLRLGTGASTQDLASIQRKLFTWYTAHSLTVQADFLMSSVSRVLGPANTMSIA